MNDTSDIPPLGVPQALEPTGKPKEVEFAALKAKLPTILKYRTVIMSLFVFFSAGLLVFFYFITQDDAAVRAIEIYIGLGFITLSCIGLIVEAVNIRRPHNWYQYVNFFIWNIFSQIGMYTSRSRVYRDKWDLIGSLATFNVKGVVSSAYDMNRAQRNEQFNIEDYRDTQVVDRYFELKRQLEFTSETPLDK